MVMVTVIVPLGKKRREASHNAQLVSRPLGPKIGKQAKAQYNSNSHSHNHSHSHSGSNRNSNINRNSNGNGNSNRNSGTKVGKQATKLN